MKSIIIESLVQEQHISNLFADALGMATSKSSAGSYSDDATGE